jgi:hypothetical protein
MFNTISSNYTTDELHSTDSRVVGGISSYTCQQVMSPDEKYTGTATAESVPKLNNL